MIVFWFPIHAILWTRQFGALVSVTKVRMASLASSAPAKSVKQSHPGGTAFYQRKPTQGALIPCIDTDGIEFFQLFQQYPVSRKLRNIYEKWSEWACMGMRFFFFFCQRSSLVGLQHGKDKLKGVYPNLLKVAPSVKELRCILVEVRLTVKNQSTGRAAIL
jgi:hypothetical protein